MKKKQENPPRLVHATTTLQQQQQQQQRIDDMNGHPNGKSKCSLNSIKRTQSKPRTREREMRQRHERERESEKRERDAVAGERETRRFLLLQVLSFTYWQIGNVGTRVCFMDNNNNNNILNKPFLVGVWMFLIFILFLALLMSFLNVLIR